MPRGKKSKHQARDKRYQEREEPRNPAGAQATAAVGGEFCSAFSPRFQSSSAAGSNGNPQGPQRAPSTVTTATRSNEGANYQVEERPRFPQAQPASGRATEPLHRSPLEEKVMLLVYYLLHKYQMKEAITKAEMLRNVIQGYRSCFLEILKRASDHLEMVFGLDVKEMDPYRHIYILVNKLELSYDAMPSDDDRGVPKTGLLMTVLGVIYTKGNCATEEQVWQMLNVIGLYQRRYHFIFGDLKKLITKDLVKEKYLEYRQVPNSDPPHYEFLWGPRSHAETTKMKVLEFLAKIHNTVPSAFTPWYEEAVRDEEERARARAAARARTAAMASARSRAMLSRSSHTK
ncbi:MAGE family member B10 [Rhinolophus ferrumequinum]|uniref:MAGE family member B10 n=1 Tax=Rhinolophus ferrumequinum TaxID=59479 RepID=A0A7J8AVY9_RHIFE|nr:melanoma-associated antigen B10-like [Rhinolophus ferrumequinum]KAF6390441.1 MAGE family member B10 [Rhinolophus ferrumequinum]